VEVTRMIFITDTNTQKQMPDLEEYMTVEEAAEILGFHPESVRRLLRDEILQGKKWRREWLALRKSIQEYSEKVSDNKHNSKRE
jgi:excisionase family DNA binding protein